MQKTCFQLNRTLVYREVLNKVCLVSFIPIFDLLYMNKIVEAMLNGKGAKSKME